MTVSRQNKNNLQYPHPVLNTSDPWACLDLVDKRWVTLGIVTWDAVGTAEQGLGLGWTLTTDEHPDPTGPDNSDAFPVWTQSIGAQ